MGQKSLYEKVKIFTNAPKIEQTIRELVARYLDTTNVYDRILKIYYETLSRTNGVAFDDMVKQCSEILEENDDTAESYFFKGMFFGGSSNDFLANKYYTKAAEKGFAFAYYQLSLTRDSKFEKILDLNQAYNLDNSIGAVVGDLAIYKNSTMSYLEKTDYVRDLEKAVQLGYPMAYWNLAMYYREKYNEEEQRKYIYYLACSIAYARDYDALDHFLNRLWEYRNRAMYRLVFSMAAIISGINFNLYLYIISMFYEEGIYSSILKLDNALLKFNIIREYLNENRDENTDAYNQYFESRLRYFSEDQKRLTTDKKTKQRFIHNTRFAYAGPEQLLELNSLSDYKWVEFYLNNNFTL